MPSGLQIRLCCCPRSRCTNRDWDESRVWWPPMRDFIRARTRKRGKRRECGGCRFPIRTPQVTNGNAFSTSVGFGEGKSGEPARRDESACSKEDTGCVVACIPVWTACAVGGGWGWLRTISSRWVAILRGRAPNPASSTRLATREWTCAKSLPKPFYVACYVAEPISESSFLRRKVAKMHWNFSWEFGWERSAYYQDRN